ncbi:hypothetical protein ABB37_09727, partial [Leptomonas pyrrhocoris]
QERDSLAAQVAQLRKTLSGLEVEMEVLSLERDLAVQDRDAAKSSVVDAEMLASEKVKELSSKLGDVSAGLAEARVQAKTALEKLGAAEKDSDEARAALQAEMIARKTEQTASRDELCAVMAQRDAALHEAESTNAELHEKVEEGRRNIALLQQQRESTSAELESSRKNLAEVQTAAAGRAEAAAMQNEESERRCQQLEAQVAQLQSEVQATKEELHHAAEKAAALMTRLTGVYGTPAGTITTTAADAAAANDDDRSGDSDGAGGAREFGSSLSSPALRNSNPQSDALLLAEVRHRLREREEAMRLLAEGVELRERARPLERILAEKMDGAEGSKRNTPPEMAMVDAAASVAAREAQLEVRAAQLKKKEQQLLRVAHELQAKSHALQTLHLRAAERGGGGGQFEKDSNDEAKRADTAPAQLPPAPITPVRAPLLENDNVETSTRGQGDSGEAVASPPPRPPPQPSAIFMAPPDDVDQHQHARGRDEDAADTQERLAAATEAYRDVLFGHILETNGLQGCRSLARYLPGPTGGHRSNNATMTDSGAGGLSDMARETRAMLRALEDRLDGSRGAPRGVDPAVQQRSLEAFRKLEKAVRSLCGANLEA